jgi:hypothetical protein
VSFTSLKSSEIEQDHGHPPAVAPAALQFAGHGLVELAVVEQPGQRIAAGARLLVRVEPRVGERDRSLRGVRLEQLDVAREEALRGPG